MTDARPTDAITAAVDSGRLVDFAEAAISVPSFTGDEQAMAELMAETLTEMELHVQWQQVEDGRANVLGTLTGSGGGRTLMFNGHMDTSYSGREPWLRHVPGFQPAPFVEDGRLYGLGWNPGTCRSHGSRPLYDVSMCPLNIRV